MAKATWPLQVDADRIVAPKLSKSDAAFQTDGCDFVWGGSDLSIEELNKLFVRVSSPRIPYTYVIWWPAEAHDQGSCWIQGVCGEGSVYFLV